MHTDSHVGISSFYADGLQRTEPQEEIEARRRNHENPPVSSRRGSVHKKEQAIARAKDSHPTIDELNKIDPTAPVSPFSFTFTFSYYRFMRITSSWERAWSTADVYANGETDGAVEND